MADIYAVAGSKIYIGGQKDSEITDFNAASFSGQTWVEIDGWETAGSIGDSSEVIKTSLINRNRVVKQKGPNDAGSAECSFAIVDGDAGQAALLAAQATKETYAFKIEWSSGDVEYFVAMVMSRTRSGGKANTVQMLNVTLEIDSNIVTA